MKRLFSNQHIFLEIAYIERIQKKSVDLVLSGRVSLLVTKDSVSQPVYIILICIRCLVPRLAYSQQKSQKQTKMLALELDFWNKIKIQRPFFWRLHSETVTSVSLSWRRP